MLNYLLGSILTGLSIYLGYIAGQKSIKQEPLTVPKLGLPHAAPKSKIVRMTPELENALKEQE